MNRTNSPSFSPPTYKSSPSFFMEGCTWCAHECFDCDEVIEVESKMRLKLAFHNHVCSDNYGDNELLPGVKLLEDVIVDHVYQSTSPPSLKASQEQDLTLKAKVQELKAEVLPSTCKHKTCFPGHCFELKIAMMKVKDVFASGPVF